MRAENDAVAEAGWRFAAVALLAMLAALVQGWSAFVPVLLAALGLSYGLQLAVDDVPLDLAAPLVAVGLIVTAELAYWSLEERESVRRERGTVPRRLAYLALLGLGAFLVAAVLLVLVDALRAGGLAIDLLGAAAAGAAIVAIALAARRAA